MLYKQVLDEDGEAKVKAIAGDDETKNILLYEIGKGPIEMEINFVFQGEPYEDPNPPTEEDIAAK
jgi:hypothetical protein